MNIIVHCFEMNLCWISGGEDIKNGKKTTKQVGHVRQACHLEQTPQKYVGVARQKLSVARWYNIPESKIEDHQRGVAHQEQGVAREPVTRRTTTVGVPLCVKGMAHQPQSSLGRAT